MAAAVRAPKPIQTVGDTAKNRVARLRLNVAADGQGDDDQVVDHKARKRGVAQPHQGFEAKQPGYPARLQGTICLFQSLFRKTGLFQ